jgi:glycosyltransferase involved in cell wall biosynthesis
LLKICYEYPPIGGGGAKVVEGLINEISKKGIQVDLVTMGYKGLSKRERIHSSNIYRIPCLRFRRDICSPGEMATYNLMARSVLNKLCTENHYALLHAHFIVPDGELALYVHRRFRIPYIVTAHGSDIPGYNPDRFKLLHIFLQPLWKRIIREANLVVFPSQYLKSLALKRNKNILGKVIPNGFNVKKFSPFEEKKDRILVVTRMFERKGVQYLLQALHGMEKYPEVVIVGDGPYLPKLKSMASHMGLNVNFMGYMDNKSAELRNLFETSRIFVFTSQSENFPTVLLEAMAAGMAIITTQETGCAEVVGDGGILVEVQNPDAIRKALRQLINDNALCAKKSRIARRRLEKHFGWPSVTHRYLEVYEQILKD